MPKQNSNHCLNPVCDNPSADDSVYCSTNCRVGYNRVKDRLNAIANWLMSEPGLTLGDCERRATDLYRIMRDLPPRNIIYDAPEGTKRIRAIGELSKLLADRKGETLQGGSLVFGDGAAKPTVVAELSSSGMCEALDHALREVAQ